MEAIVVLLDPFKLLSKKIRKKIQKNRNDITPGMEAAHDGLVADMAVKMWQMVMILILRILRSCWTT